MKKNKKEKKPHFSFFEKKIITFVFILVDLLLVLTLFYFLDTNGIESQSINSKLSELNSLEIKIEQVKIDIANEQDPTSIIRETSGLGFVPITSVVYIGKDNKLVKIDFNQ